MKSNKFQPERKNMPHDYPEKNPQFSSEKSNEIFVSQDIIYNPNTNSQV